MDETNFSVAKLCFYKGMNILEQENNHNEHISWLIDCLRANINDIERSIDFLYEDNNRVKPYLQKDFV